MADTKDNVTTISPGPGHNNHREDPEYKKIVNQIMANNEKRRHINKENNLLRAQAKERGYPARATNDLVRWLEKEKDVRDNEALDFINAKLAFGEQLEMFEKEVFENFVENNAPPAEESKPKKKAKK